MPPSPPAAAAQGGAHAAPPQGVVFHGVSFDPRTHDSHTFTRDQLDHELADPEVFSWIDVQAPDIGALNDVLRRLDIDLVLVGHFDNPEVLPRIVERFDCLAFYLYEIFEPERHLDTSHGLREIEFARMILVLGADYAITYHRRPLDAVEHVKVVCAEEFRLAGKTPGFIAFLFMQRCLYDYAHLNLANDNFLDLIEARVLSGDQQRLAAEVSLAGGNILTLKRLTASLQIVLMILGTKRNRFVSAEARSFFNEMLQNAFAVREAIGASHDLLDGILQRVQTAAANRTSEIARALTVMSGILLPLSLVAGIYGMNFQHMPELAWPNGYYYVLGGMAVLGVGLFLAFRRIGWVDNPRSEGR